MSGNDSVGFRRLSLSRWSIRVMLGLLAGLAIFISVPSPALAADGGPPPAPAGTSLSDPGPSDSGLRGPRTLAPNGSYFGPVLDWNQDSADRYIERLKASPSVFGETVGYPLSADGERALRRFVQQASQHGALAQLTLEPRNKLSALTDADATALAVVLQDLHTSFDTGFFVRFAPEMNGSWTSWGQQPVAYVNAFRTVARAVHSLVPSAAMVWAPAYGAGYPFTKAYGAVEGIGAGSVKALDTNGNGTVDPDDDPYAPYYPGDDATDWVGLSIYHFGTYQQGNAFSTSVVPENGKFLAQLAGTYGYADQSNPARDFIGKYATAKNKRLALQTGALYNPGNANGGSELAIKQAWWQQITDPEVRARYPQLGLITWLEQQRPEAEAGNAVVDWRATASPPLADVLREKLSAPASGIILGPVTRVNDQRTSNQATSQIRDPGTTTGEPMGWIVLCAVILFALFAASALALKFLPAWRYPKEKDPRDLRLDLLRGWIITAVVITHIELAGPYSYLALNAIGAISGAELFVLLSGLVMGMVYPRAVKKLGTWLAMRHTNQRALRLYLTSLGVVLAVYLLSLIPWVDGRALTTFTDRGTGQGGQAVAGRVYDLYGNAPRLFDYPPPWYAVRDLLTLSMGPWVFNIMGLFVVLTLLVPAIVWLLQRRLWWLVIFLSWALYLLDAVYGIRVISSQFQDVFPLLTWQIAFTHGIVIGYYRQQIIGTLFKASGMAIAGVSAGVYALGLGLLWANDHFALGLSWVPAGLYQSLYDNLYTRIFLQPGRLIDLLLFLTVSFIVLTAFWKPLSTAVGWLYIPLGQSSLYVFIVHVFFVLAVANVPGLDRASFWQGLLIHSAVMAVIWLMVRRKFLFKLISN